MNLVCLVPRSGANYAAMPTYGGALPAYGGAYAGVSSAQQ